MRSEVNGNMSPCFNEGTLSIRSFPQLNKYAFIRFDHLPFFRFRMKLLLQNCPFCETDFASARLRTIEAK